MNRTTLPRVALVLAVCAAIAACSRSSGSARDAGAVDGEITSCPPAPLEFEFEGRPCHDPQLGCPYASPNGFWFKWPTICDLQDVGQCLEGVFRSVEFYSGPCCPEGPGDVTWCSQPITEGAPCNEPDNSECVLPGESATCACDKPGPIWRCLPIDGGVHYCCLSGNCTDAGADGGADGGAG